jgi:hypothetical protein
MLPKQRQRAKAKKWRGGEKRGMDLIALINPGVVALSTTAAATPLFSRVAPKLGLTDVPDTCKRHSGKMPPRAVL